MISKQTWTKGFGDGVKTTWGLSKIIFPTTLIVTLLQYTPVIHWFVHLFSPMMKLFGLSGDAAIVLTLGNLLNIYAAIGAMLTMTLTVKQVFILSVMVSLSHNLLVETSIASKMGVKAWIMALIRLSLAFLSAAMINLIWRGGQETAKYGLLSVHHTQLHGWFSILMQGIKTGLLGVGEMGLIVIPLMVAVQIIKDINALPYLAKGMTPFTRILGVSENTVLTLMAGLVFGLSYGAGVIIQAAKEDNLSKKDLYLISIFLVACHAVFEDSLLFVPLGVNLFILLLFRLLLAVFITALTAKIWSQVETKLTETQNYSSE